MNKLSGPLADVSPQQRCGLSVPLSSWIAGPRLKHVFTIIAALAVSALLAACGDELSCSTTPTKQLVDKITRDQLRKELPAGDPQPDQVALALNEIITTEKTKTRAACKAKLQMSLPSAGTTPAEMPITYHVEKTDDGRLYVTIFGL